jgi:hypothetical protein
MKNAIYSSLVAALLFAAPTLLAGQSAGYRWLPKSDSFRLKITSMVQLWSTYSTRQEVFNTATSQYEPVDDRLNFSFRRARLVFNGDPYPRLSYTVALFYDQTGYDILSAGLGATNKDQPSVGIWDAFGQYRLGKKRSAPMLTAGYFRPQMQRESITTAWAPTSFEKAMSQNYVRRHLVGTGPGRATGLNIGGLWLAKNIGLNYNAGLFTPVAGAFDGSSGGRKWAPLWAGRLSLQLGQPEMTAYKIAYETNYFNQRRGLSLDFNASSQGATDRFNRSVGYGPGFLFNWGPFNADGEWIWMQREGAAGRAGAQTGHLRGSYNLKAGRYLLEPAAMIMVFSGETTSEGQSAAAALGMSSGSEYTYDAGLNFYFDRRNLKLYLHYVWRQGDAAAAGEGAQVNAFFSQPGVGAIRRGNYWGLGCNAIF